MATLNIGRDAPDIILSKKPSSQVKRKSKSSEYEDLESEFCLKDSKLKIPKFENFNLEDEDKQICSFIFKADKTDSLRFINQTRNYEETQKYNRLGSALQSQHLSAYAMHRLCGIENDTIWTILYDMHDHII